MRTFRLQRGVENTEGFALKPVISILALERVPDWEHKLLIDSKLAISTFGEDEGENLYIADHEEGGVYQIEAGSKP